MKVPKHIDELVDALKDRARGKARLGEAMERLFSKPMKKKQTKQFLTQMTRAGSDGHIWTPEDVAGLRWFAVMHKANPEQIENAFALLAVKAVVEGRKKHGANTAQTVEATFWKFLAALRQLEAVGWNIVSGLNESVNKPTNQQTNKPYK